jgi:hypothetical protein
MRYALIVYTLLLAVLLITYRKWVATTDSYIRDRVVLIHSINEMCTGVKIIAPSKQTYILTAYHCHDIAKKGLMAVQDEQGHDHYVKILDEDPDHDLLLLQAYDNEGVEIANKLRKHEHIHAITHGNNMPSWRSDGEVLKETLLQIPVDDIKEEDCKGPGLMVEHALFNTLCMKSLLLVQVKLLIWPGSSGGPVLNSMGKLVGIANVNDDSHQESAAMVPLRDIKFFLKNR